MHRIGTAQAKHLKGMDETVRLVSNEPLAQLFAVPAAVASRRGRTALSCR